MAEPDRQALLTMLTTEHFTLQGSRATTVSESSSRAALYMGSVSSTLIALGFLAQVSQIGDAFDVFALVVLPTLFALGIFTFVRTVESSVEDVLYGRAINRIRAYYLEMAGPEARWFVMKGHDDALGVLANMGLQPSRWQLYFTVSTMVATVNSVVGGSAVAILVGRLLDASLGVAAVAGVIAAAAAFAVHWRWDRILHERHGGYEEVLFPTP
jgi:uncharacterized membrane protein YphA (DoxX/SURF4 family)